MLGGAQVVVSPYVEDRHVGDYVLAIEAHPLAAFFLRLFRRPTHVMWICTGKITEPEYLMLGGKVICSSRGYEKLRQELAR
jgi:hypothetical protein